MNKAVICLSFDDGRKDNLEVIYGMLIPMNITSVVNITTGYVDGSCPVEMRPSKKPAMSVEEVIELSRQPLVEIALHGDRHLNTEEDVAEGKRKIIEWLKLPENAKLGFASPSCNFDITAIGNDGNDFFSDELLYVRSGMHIASSKWARIGFRKFGRIIHIPEFFRIAYADTLMQFDGQKGLYSVPVLKDTSVAQVLAIVDECIIKKKLLILQFHSIVENTDNEDNWSWSLEKFKWLCKYIKEKADDGLLKICTTKELFTQVGEMPYGKN